MNSPDIKNFLDSSSEKFSNFPVCVTGIWHWLHHTIHGCRWRFEHDVRLGVPGNFYVFFGIDTIKERSIALHFFFPPLFNCKMRFYFSNTCTQFKLTNVHDTLYTLLIITYNNDFLNSEFCKLFCKSFYYN